MSAMDLELPKKPPYFNAGFLTLIVTLVIQIIVGTSYVQSIKGQNETIIQQLRNDERRLDDLDRRMNVSEEERKQIRIALERIDSKQESIIETLNDMKARRK